MTRRALLATMVILALALPCTAATTRAALTSVDSEIKETELGDLISDALRALDAKAAIAIFPAGSLKDATVPEGEVKADEVKACLKFPEDKTSVLELTGDQILRALERSVGTLPQKNQGFLQVSGLSLTVNPKSPKGSRVSDVKVGKDVIDKEKKYRVITTAPLAKGGHGYFTIWDKKAIVEAKADETSMSTAVEQFLSKQNSLDYREKKRIVVKDK